MYGDDGLIERIKWWTRGNRDRIITSLVNLAKHFDVVKEVAVKLVDALGEGIPANARHRGHGKGPWDDISGAVKRRRRQTDSAADFAENVVVPDCPPPYPPLIRQREIQSMTVLEHS